MLALAINTASQIESVSIFDERRALAEHAWRGNADETKKLLPNILSVLKKARKNFSSLDKIIAVTGPGPFSATRIGVTVANTLAHALKIPLYTISTRGLWQLRGGKKRILLIHAGGTNMEISGAGIKPKVHDIKSALGLRQARGKLEFFGDLRENEPKGFIPEHKLIKTGEALRIALQGAITDQAQHGQSNLKRGKIAIPQYFHPPNITKPRHAQHKIHT